MKLKPIFFFVFTVFSVAVSSQNAELDLLLRMDIEHLMNTKITSAAKTEQKLSEASATVRVVTAEEIKERAYLTLEDLLRDQPGFQFRDIQGFNSYAFQRGISNQNNLMLVMIDGVQVNELNSGGFYGGAQYLLGNIQQVEIIYGPSSALYGTNAVSGLINLITKKPSDAQGLDISFGLGSFKSAIGEARFAQYDSASKTGFSLASRYFTTEKRPLGGKQGGYNWTENIENFEQNIAVDLGVQHHDLFFGINLMNKKASRASNYRTFDTDFSDQGTLWNMLFANAQLQWHYESNNFLFNPKAYYRNSTLLPNSVAFADSLTQTAYFRPSSLIGLDVMGKYQLHKNASLILGVIGESENLSDNFGQISYPIQADDPPKAPKPAMNRFELLSFYAQTDFQFLKYFYGIAGLRYDHSSYYGYIVTPRLSIGYKNKKIASSLLYNEAFRAPRPWDFTYGVGNPLLQPEKMRSIEWVNGLQLGQAWMFNATFYVNDYENLLSLKQNGDDNWQWINSGKVQTSGMEFEVKYFGSQFKAWVNYTFNNSVNEQKELIPEISKHIGNAGFHHYLGKAFNYGFRLNYGSSRKNASLYTSTGETTMRYPEIDPYFVVNFSATYAFHEQAECLVAVNNILNTKYYHSSNRPPERYPQAGRNLFLQFNFKLSKEK